MRRSESLIPLTRWDLEPHRARFEARVKRTATCWLWTRERDAEPESGRYRREARMCISLAGERRWTGILAARAAYYYYHGRVPTIEELVYRSCGRSLCVRPDHLVLVPLRPSSDDMIVVGGNER